MYKSKGISSNRAKLGKMLRRGFPVKSSNDVQNIIKNAVYKTLTELSIDLSEYVPRKRYSETISFLFGIIVTIILCLSTAFTHDVSIFDIFTIPSLIICKIYQFIALVALIVIIVLLCVRKTKKRKTCNNTTLAENISHNCDFSEFVFVSNSQRMLPTASHPNSMVNKDR